MSSPDLGSTSRLTPSRLTTVQWLICIVASIGFAFDIYELLMLPLIIKPAILSLAAPEIAATTSALVADGMSQAEAAVQARQPWLPGGAQYVQWARVLFFVPALAGGVFGLLGGYLTDLLGRRRVLTFSILLYAASACAAGFSTSLTQLLIFRCLVFIGVCVEFVAAVAWLAELFEDRERREKVLGYTQAFSSLGGLLVAFMNVQAAQLARAELLPAIYGDREAWRYTLISGVIPALPLIILRPFLPESPEWKRKRDAGTLKRPSILELFSPGLIRTTILTTLVFAASYGIAFGAIQQLPQILGAPVKGHVDVRAIATEARENAIAAAEANGEPAPTEGALKQAERNATDESVAKVTFWQEIGGLVGRVLLALLVVRIVSRRLLLRLFQAPALFLVPLYFWWVSQNLESEHSLLLIKIGIFLCGLFTVAQFSFWGNYIPLVFPVHLRGTGESFAANIGGRILGTAAAFITITLSESKPPDPAKIAIMGALVAGGYALVGTVLAHWLPEPKEAAGAEKAEKA
jgi:MFS family permease